MYIIRVAQSVVELPATTYLVCIYLVDNSE